jgi:hypothetical protein
LRSKDNILIVHVGEIGYQFYAEMCLYSESPTFVALVPLVQVLPVVVSLSIYSEYSITTGTSSSTCARPCVSTQTGTSRPSTRTLFFGASLSERLGSDETKAFGYERSTP